MTCSIEGCDKPLHGKHWCAMHYWRIKRHGSPDKVLPMGPKPGSNWAEDPNYYSLHKRLTKMRGSAKDYTCSCGEPATQWAYVGAREPGARMPFGANLDDYQPMCVTCHKRMDMQAIQEERFRPV